MNRLNFQFSKQLLTTLLPGLIIVGLSSCLHQNVTGKTLDDNAAEAYPMSAIIVGTIESEKLQGFESDDIITGGEGADLFPFTTGNDVITDFNPNEDILDVGDFARPEDEFETLISISAIQALATEITDSTGITSVVIDVDGPLGQSTTKLHDVRIQDLNTNNVFFGLEGNSVPPLEFTHHPEFSIFSTSCNLLRIPFHSNEIHPLAEQLIGSEIQWGDEPHANDPNDIYPLESILTGFDQSEKLQGFESNDIVTGGNGADLFPLTLGSDIITDFNPNEDMLDVGDFARPKDKFETLNSLAAIAALSQSVQDEFGVVSLVIDVDGPFGSATTTLYNITLADLNSNNVFFGLDGDPVPPLEFTHHPNIIIRRSDNSISQILQHSDDVHPLPEVVITEDTTTTTLLGDVNLDGEINLLDIGPFIELLSSGRFQTEADMNQDGVVNLTDVQPFVQVLSGV